MNSKYLKFLFLLLVGIAFLTPQINAEGKGKEKKLSKTQGLPNRTYLNINNLSTQIYNDGNSDIQPNGNSGVIYPKGSGKGAVFESGFIWGAKVPGDNQVRVGGSTYSQGLQPGKILSPGVAESPELDKNRIYRVRPDVFPGGPDVDLTLAAVDEGSSASALRAQYDADWTEWPVADGAPFNDVDSNGVYDPNVDIPGVPGADQTIWFVANDLDGNKTSDLYGAQPLGIEMQATFWAYAQAGALGNMFFRKYTIINKSETPFNDMYVSMWSDVDLGDSNDDYGGCDTTLSLGYVYNATNNDATYTPLNPPAVGFDFFQGPIVPGEPTDTAIFNGKYVVGKTNLPMTAYYYFIRGDPQVNDPVLGSIEGSTQFYNFMQGKIGTTGEFFVNPVTGQPTTFTLSGNPQTGEGWLDGQLQPAGDRRIGSASGPFQMAPGDTQEVVVAEIVAGASGGVSNIDAVGLLKNFDQKAQEAYDNFFILPSPPPKPNLQASGLDKQIILNWGFSSGDVIATENYDFKGFKFEGYNLYQLPSASAGLDLAKRLATYDVINGITTILGPVIDPATGLTLEVPQQFGSDAGLKRFFTINKDIFTNRPLVNGIRYYFAVTAYAFNPDSLAVPNNLENPLSIITVIPQEPNPGVRFTSTQGDTIQNVSHSGGSDGSVVAIVVDPSKTTGDEYRVNFTDNQGETTWSVTNVRTGTVVAANQTNQGQEGPDAYPIVDGVMIKVFGPQPDFKDFLEVANVNGPHEPTYASFTFNGSGFPSSFPVEAPTDRPTPNPAGASWGIQTGNADDASFDYAWFKSRVLRGDNGTRLIPYDYELRFTAAGGKAYLAFTNEANVDVPFEIWNIGISTPDDPSDDYRMTPLVLDNNENNVFDLSGVDNPISGGDNDPETDWIYWYLPVNTAAGTAGYDAYVTKLAAGDTAGALNEIGDEVMARMVLVNFNAGSVSDPAFPGNLVEQLPPTGTVYRLISTKPNTTNDSFTLTAPPVNVDAELAKVDLERVNVFPNPYYGVNSEELNKYNRFVTFTHLPAKATIRIFNLAGVLVQTIEKDDPSQFTRWDLANESGLPVASGLYLAHIDMPDQGMTKILKVAIIQEQQILDRF